MSKVKKTRNDNQWTEARYWQQVRSFLRRAFRYWKPMQKAKLSARRIYKGKNKRQKWEFQCNHCKNWFKSTEVQVDHIIPVGSLKCEEDLVDWLKRLTPEDPTSYQVLCIDCHKIKSQNERKKTG